MLIELEQERENIFIDIRYATSDNFTQKPVYTHPHCFLHVEAYAHFQKACELAEKMDLTFKVFDAFRPQEAQEKLWAHTPDPNFLTPPERGSPHSRGVAVDLTLTTKEGVELEMGTPFDTFSPQSHHGNLEISEEAQRNRYLLMGIMTTAGWDFYKNEWWHYQLFNARDRFALLYDKDAPKQMMG